MIDGCGSSRPMRTDPGPIGDGDDDDGGEERQGLSKTTS